MSQPFYFGTGARRLFGIYTPPSGPPLNRGVLLCQPWGQEYLRAHRSFRLLADALARKGLHVLRFDYYGTGDSEGDGDGVHLAGLVEDALTAEGELRALTGIRRSGVVGLRLGAVVAARVAADRGPVRRLALWDPVVSGADHARELTSRATPDPAAPSICAGEVDGFPLPRRLLEEVEEVGLDRPDDDWTISTLLAVTEEGERSAALREALETRIGERFEYGFRPGPRAWQQELDFGAGAVPAALLDLLAGWDW
jgi:alpha/beta superfamily hydrolase